MHEPVGPVISFHFQQLTRLNSTAGNRSLFPYLHAPRNADYCQHLLQRRDVYSAPSAFAEPSEGVSQRAWECLKRTPGLRIVSPHQFDYGGREGQPHQDIQRAQQHVLRILCKHRTLVQIPLNFSVTCNGLHPRGLNLLQNNHLPKRTLASNWSILEGRAGTASDISD